MPGEITSVPLRLCCTAKDCDTTGCLRQAIRELRQDGLTIGYYCIRHTQDLITNNEGAIQ